MPVSSLSSLSSQQGRSPGEPDTVRRKTGLSPRGLFHEFEKDVQQVDKAELSVLIILECQAPVPSRHPCETLAASVWFPDTISTLS